MFFDKEAVSDPLDNGKKFVLPKGISASDSGRGLLVLGDILLTELTDFLLPVTENDLTKLALSSYGGHGHSVRVCDFIDRFDCA